MHITRTHSELGDPCDNRGNTASSNIDMSQHSTNIHSEPCEPSDNSGNTSNTNTDLRVHSDGTHSEITEPVNVQYCDKCGNTTTCNCDTQVHTSKIHDERTKWRDYDKEFKIIVDCIHEKLINSEVTPAEAATEFNSILLVFLESKSDIIKEVKQFYKHKPKSTTVVDDARKLKNSLEKKAKKKSATTEDKSAACEALRHYDHILKEHKESLKATEIHKQEKAYRTNFHKFAKEITNGTYNQTTIGPSYTFETGNKFYKERYSKAVDIDPKNLSWFHKADLPAEAYDLSPYTQKDIEEALK